MSQELAVLPPRTGAITTGTEVAAIIPTTFEDVYRMAGVLCKSRLVPYDMDTPEKVTVSILTGLELGVKPMQAVQGIAVINGRPCVWGDLALGIVRGSGLVEEIEEFYEGTPPSTPAEWKTPTGDMLNFKAVCIVKRRGASKPVRQEYSIQDAIVAKLWQKKGGKNGDRDTPWVTNPKRMLKMRARGFNLRDEFTDVLKGMYLVEEMIGTEEEDGAPERSRRTPPKAPQFEKRAEAAQIAKPAEPDAAAQPNPNLDAERQPQQDTSAPQREVIEEADFSEESRVEGSASSDQPEHDPIDVDGELEALRDKLSHATSTVQAEQFYAEMDIEADLEGVEGAVKRARDILDETLDRLTKAEQEKAAAAAPKPAEPENDPFEIPLGFEDTRDFEIVIGAAVMSVTDKESGEKLKALWKGIGDQIRDAGIRDEAVRRWQGLVIKKLKEHGVPVKEQPAPAAEPPKTVEEKQPEPTAGIDLSVPAKTADEYRAHVEEHIRLAVTKADAEPLKKWYFSTSKLRDDLKIPESQRASLKDPLFERARVLRDLADGQVLAG